MAAVTLRDIVKIYGEFIASVPTVVLLAVLRKYVMAGLQLGTK